jgi:hypothetical protein
MKGQLEPSISMMFFLYVHNILLFLVLTCTYFLIPYETSDVYTEKKTKGIPRQFLAGHWNRYLVNADKTLQSKLKLL